MQTDFDVLIIGGGVNGAGMARDAAGRGLRVCLLEQGDLASGTSSASTKMIHGGLRYLEYNEFALVRQALKEREKLLKIAPHLIAPLRIVLPILPDMRPAWLIRLGLWLYDHLGGKISLPPTSNVSLQNSAEGKDLAPGPIKAFAYFDGWVDDARLVVLNALAAHELGAQIQTRCKVTKISQHGDLWQVHTDTGQTIRTKCVINAAGPWADTLDQMAGFSHARHIVKVQGSHIVLPKLYDGDHAYLFQNPDRRVLFAIPYQGKFTLFGTTDTPISGDPGAAHLTQDETEYLLTAIHRFFAKKPTKDDIVWSYSGVRALFGDPGKEAAALSRDYELVMDPPGATPPFLSVLGGKITTYRSLSEKAINMVCQRISCPSAAPWTAKTPLPGGDLDLGGFDALVQKVTKTYPFLSDETCTRMAHAYGTRVFDILGTAKTKKELGIDFGAGLFEREVRHFLGHEWAKTAEDILWRRSKRGLHLTPAQIKNLENWLEHI